MTQMEYHIWFPKQDAGINNNELTFSIGNMKCREYAVVFFIIHGYDVHGDELYSVNDEPIYTSNRWVVDGSYSEYVEPNIYLTNDILDDLATIQIELVAIGVDDDNPLYMTQIMLTDEFFTTYHAPNEVLAETDIGFIRNAYVNLYTNNLEGYLQVIRPSKSSITNRTLLANDVTVLAPHLDNEEDIDAPQNILYEFLNQVEEKTTINMDNFTM